MKRIIYSFVSLLFTIAVLITVSYAWFTNSEFVEPEISGYSVAAYFGGGDGSAEHPFQIKSKRHLYNLAWLQYLGKFNQPGSGNVPNLNNTTSLTQYSFVLDDNITIKPEESNDWKLPPIGTTKYPFIGSLDGNGHTITGLTTTNKFDELSRHPGNVVKQAQSGTNQKEFGNAEIIGFIGTVGKIDGMEYSTYSISSESNNVKNLILNNTTVHTTTPETLCGIVAGYINGTVSNVGVVNGSLDIGFGTAIENQDSVSSYTVAGYATDDYLTKVSNNKTIVMNPIVETKKFTYEAQGNITAWGGSVNFTSIYKDVLRPKWDLSDGSTNYTYKYNTKETITLDANGEVISNVGSNPTYERWQISDLGYHRLTYAEDYVNDDQNNKKIAGYSFLYREDENSFMYFSGNKERTVSNALTITTKYPYAFRITDDGNYLKQNTNTSITNTTSTTADIKTYWYLDNSGHIYNLKDDKTKLYLNDNNGSLVLANNATTTWTINEEDDYYVDNFGRYLIYNNGWKLDSLFETRNGYKIKQGDYYLNYSTTTTVTGGNNENNASIWYLDSNNRLYTIKNNNNYYLYWDDGGWFQASGVKLSTTTQSNYFYKDGNYIRQYGTNRYLRYNDGWTRGNNNTTYTNTFTDVSETIRKNYYTYKTSSVPDTVQNNVTVTYKTDPMYIPLMLGTDLNGDKGVDVKNTGYIIGGSNVNTSQFADIRVSKYAISNISSSYKNSSFTNNIYTINAKNGTPQVINNNLINQLGWTKYQASKADFGNVLSKDSSYVYGLHFMNANIDKNHKIVADWVSINGSDYISNYELPEDCIDFNLMEKGKVNFFAGDYFSGNKSFFSYHEIQRSGNTITDIKQISAVYSDGIDSHSYVYLYSDGKYSVPYSISNVNGVKIKKKLDGSSYTEYSTQLTLPSGYSQIFNMDWIGTNSNLSKNTRLFYFEVPTNDGEYALGSVSGSNGAYLLYLDIGANAQQVDRTEIQQKTEVTKYDYAFPNGIAIIIDGTAVADIKAASSAVVKVLNAGTITLSRTENTITATGSIPTAVNLTSTYISREVTLNDVSTAMTASAVKTTTSIYSQIQYIDYNATTQDIFETNIIRSKTIYSDGTPTVVSPIDLSIFYVKNGREKIFDTRDGDTDTTSDNIKTSDGLVSWKLYGIYTDSSNVNRNITYRLNGSQPKFTNETDDMVTKRTEALTKLTNTLTSIESHNRTSELVYDYDTAAEKNSDNPPVNIDNTFDCRILSVLDSSKTEGVFYKFNGDDITITTNNTGGITVYITTNSPTYTFKINRTQRTGTDTDGFDIAAS